jgi:hypothetical protein
MSKRTLFDVVKNGMLVGYIQPMLNAIENADIEVLTKRDPNPLISLSPVEAVGKAIMDLVIASRETRLGQHVYEPSLRFLATETRGEQAIFDCKGVDWYAAAVPGYGAEYVEAKSGTTWANSKSRKGMNDTFVALARQHDGEVKLTECIFHGRKKHRTILHEGYKIERYSGARAFQHLGNDPDFGLKVGAAMDAVMQKYLAATNYDSLQSMIEHYAKSAATRIVDTYSNGYKGYVLWTGNRLHRDNLRAFVSDAKPRFVPNDDQLDLFRPAA